MGLRLDVLGPLEVHGHEVVELTRPTHRRLLAILALDAGVRRSTDALIDRFWAGDPPAQAKAALQTHVSALRRQLGPDVIVTEGYGYRLDRDAVTIDVDGFTAAADAAREHARQRAWEAALDLIEQGLARWRGTPYAELVDDAFAAPERARLEEVHRELLGHRTDALLALGRVDEALPHLERLVVDHPLHERYWEQLLVARYRLGRHADALAAYRRCREQLAELGLEPGPELRRLQQRVLRHDVGLHAPGQHNLPAELSSFVGRDRELAEVAALLDAHRLVTLTGVGGSGKTRLARRIALDHLPRAPDGCWLVELAALDDPELVAREVASTLGVRSEGQPPLDTLRTALTDATLLVVLDNCEHLVTAAARVARTLAEAGPGVRVLATSRVALGITGEAVYEVPPMAYPTSDELDPDVVRRYDAVRLFAERAATGARGPNPVETDTVAVTTICRRLDGVPLAIELAAARVRSLGAAAIAARLDDRFRLLTDTSATSPPRQRTLEATVAWSYGLLSPDERRLFTRLGVFQDGFDLEMAERIVADGDVVAAEGIGRGQVAALLGRLVDHCLVTTFETRHGRAYRLLETLRAYARERLDASEDAAAVRERHLDWCVGFADEVRADGLWWGATGVSRARLAEVVEDLRAALEFRCPAPSTPGPDPQVETLAAVLGWYWGEHQHVQLALRHLQLALTACGDATREAELRTLLGRTRFEAGDVDGALDDAERAVALVRRAPPSRTAVEALTRYARLLRLLVDHAAAEAVPVVEEAVAVASQLDDPLVQVRARAELAQVLGWSGAIDAGLDHHRAALEQAAGIGDQALTMSMYGAFFDLLYLHPTARRDEPERVSEELLRRLSDDDTDLWLEFRHGRLDYLPYVYLQTGAWDRAEELIDRLGARHLEGYGRTWHLMTAASLRWMQGRLAEARRHLDELERMGVNPRWYHDYFPLRAEVAAEAGELPQVVAAAERYLAVDLDPSEASNRLGVLAPVVRARVDAALDATGAQRDRHLAEADAVLERMAELLATHPPPTGGSLQLETAATHLALARAERTRAGAPDPAAWRDAVERCDYAYTRAYARSRLVEALVAAGERGAASAELRAVAGAVIRSGAARVRTRLDRLAVQLDVDLEVEAAPAG